MRDRRSQLRLLVEKMTLLLGTGADPSERSLRLRELQSRIAIPVKSSDEAFKRFMAPILKNDQREAISAYIGMCAADKGVAAVMDAYALSTERLREIYERLNAAGLDQWINGHNVALSSIAYAETLRFVLEAERRRICPLVTRVTLLEYWEGAIPKRKLMRYIDY